MKVLRVFGFEDELEWLERIVSALRREISPDDQKRYGIRSIELHIATSKREGVRLLREAVSKRQPPDVILLDLRIPLIPLEEGGVPENEIGIELLQEAQKINAVGEVLVYSFLGPEYELAVDAFSGGAIDFVRKRVATEEELLARVLAAGARLLARENAKLLEQRLKDLVPYAETGLAHRFGVCFSRFVQSVVNETEGLEEGMKERWGLDVERDSQDSQVRHLIEMQAAVQQAKKDWTDIVTSLMDHDELATDCVVEETLAEVETELMPSLSLNRVQLNANWGGKTVVRTFRNGANDVKAVLKEILLGALSESTSEENDVTHGSDNTKKLKDRPVDIHVATNDGQAVVQFKESLSRIDERSASLINGGMIIPPGGSFGRAWGLSVAQHLAQRGGGRIKVDSDGTDNVITYSIPLADYAKSSSGR
jgi:CheY-like chemotaxis protein